MRIGNFEVQQNISLLIPRGQKAHIPLAIDLWELEVELSIEGEDGGGKSSNAGVTVAEAGANRALIKLLNWDSPLGTSMNSPVHLGRSGQNGIDIYFLVAHWRVGQIDRVDLQIMTGGDE